MGYNPDIHRRRSIRLKGYDYSQAGLYFVTICVQNRHCLFGKITDNEMILNDAGKIAQQCWLEIPQHFPDVILHECIMASSNWLERKKIARIMCQRQYRDARIMR